MWHWCCMISIKGKMWIYLCACPARPKLQPPAVLVWPLCGYRCFTSRLVKLSEREKLLPQFVREGGGIHLGGGGYWHWTVCGRSIDRNYCVGSAERFSIPILCQERPYCFWIELKYHFLRNDLFVCLCVTCQLAHSLAVGVYAIHSGRKVTRSQGHGVAGSALWREETGLISERLAASCSDWRVHRGHCLSSGYPASKFYM